MTRVRIWFLMEQEFVYDERLGLASRQATAPIETVGWTTSASDASQFLERAMAADDGVNLQAVALVPKVEQIDDAKPARVLRLVKS